MTEQELLERCREGEREARRELYACTSERVYRLLLRMTANPDDAFDLAQETYLKAFARIAQFDGRSSIATWLYRVAVNEGLQFLRRREKLRVTLQEAAIAPTDRAMLLLRYQEGLDYRTIAEVLGCAEGTVASRLNRARQRVREILQESYARREEMDAAEHPIGGLRMSDGE